MKVGILTIHNTTNFGSTLQAYATFKAIERLGVECEIIDYSTDVILKKEQPLKFSDIRSLKHLYYFISSERKKKSKLIEQRKFLEGNVKFTKKYDKRSLHELNDKYQTIIVGSDVVWGERNFVDDFSYFLDFVDDGVDKVSFASSVGDRWIHNEEKIKALLLRFKYISVREKSTAMWVSTLLNKNVDYTCDPTMLFTKDEWLELIDKNNRVIQEPYVLVYFNDSQNNNLKNAIEYGKKHNMPVYYINFRRRINGTKSVKPVKVEEFLNLIYFADTVFSASYHGLLFSLYFNKNIFFYNRGFKERMSALADTLDINYREQTKENLMIDKPIDYKCVEEKIALFREQSYQILSEKVLNLREN